MVKINSRPVYYFHKTAFENQFFKLDKNFYQTVLELKKMRPLLERKQDLFSLLVGYDKSLSRSIEQIKTALNYPDNGLPVLITGESGTGKSYLIHLIHKYCLENNIIEENAPLITLNYAQYANNPELLTSNLFGHTKGAFTGAEEEKKGAFEAADGGILFLDEVHRLNAEGQEKLFTYLDQGIIYRMGDTGDPIPIKTRLFFATTEELASNFLITFIRRIPIQIELPPLKARSRNERLELLYSFLISEQRKIKKQLRVSGQVLTLFANSDFNGNIGELKNNVRVTVAKAFSEQKKKSELKITIYHLADKLLASNTPTLQDVKHNEVVIDEHTLANQLIEKNKPKHQRINVVFERILMEFLKEKQDLLACENKVKQEVDNLFDLLLFETDRQQKHDMLIYLTQYIRATLKQMESSYQVKFNGNSIYAISYYLFQRGAIEWYPEDPEIHSLIKKMEFQVASAYPTSYNYVHRIIELCKPKLDLDVSLIDKIILTIYLKQADWTKTFGIPKAIIVAHGYATASSIANVTNHILGKNIFESFDMPLNVTPQQIAEEIIEYSETNDISNGLVILVDMGSLKEIYQYFPKQMSTPIVIMNNVTTPIAISIGENLQKKQSLQAVVQKATMEASLDWEIIYPNENKAKAIITTCLTGIGMATHISHLLEKSLPSECELTILPYEYANLYNQKEIETIFSMYDILGVIGTANPEIDGLPYLSLEELIAGDEKQSIANWLTGSLSINENKIFNTNIIRNFSLEKVIDSVTILDTEKVMREIELFMRNLEVEAQITIGNAQKLALFVHVSCLIERLIRNIPIETYVGYEDLAKCQRKLLNNIKRAFSVIENDYSVKIPDSEIAYIYDILYRKPDRVQNDEEF
ncbi:sigma-54 dependent transcriptional regulator of gfr operon [Enterococcus rivorum]|nr:sigma-54 dependent transcriptional regulator of gfr operon [Enterococcus rivorum]